MLNYILIDRDSTETLAVITGKNHEEIKVKCAKACQEHFANEGSIVGYDKTEYTTFFFSFKEFKDGFKRSVKAKPIIIY